MANTIIARHLTGSGKNGVYVYEIPANTLRPGYSGGQITISLPGIQDATIFTSFIIFSTMNPGSSGALYEAYIHDPENGAYIYDNGLNVHQGEASSHMLLNNPIQSDGIRIRCAENTASSARDFYFNSGSSLIMILY